VIIQMSQPWRHPKTGVLYFRGRVPSDLVRFLSGRSIAVDVEGVASTVKLGSLVKVSLRTKDAAQARLRHASVQVQLQQRWAAARKGAVSLTHKDLVALAGEWYRDLVHEHHEEPGRLFLRSCPPSTGPINSITCAADSPRTPHLLRPARP
jgi:hypothetical protein